MSFSNIFDTDDLYEGYIFEEVIKGRGEGEV